MNREIKFRQIITDDFGTTRIHYWGIMEDGNFVMPLNLGRNSEQYIGRKDKNGKEIWEGDRIIWLDTYGEIMQANVVWKDNLVGFDMPRLNGKLIPVEILK